MSLANCPKCLADDFHVDKMLYSYGDKIEDEAEGWQVQCNGCFLTGPLSDTRRDAEEAWNVLFQRRSELIPEIRGCAEDNCCGHCD